MYKNSELMPSYPPEGRGPDGVPIGQAVPNKRMRKQKANLNNPVYPAYLGQPSGAL